MKVSESKAELATVVQYEGDDLVAGSGVLSWDQILKLGDSVPDSELEMMMMKMMKMMKMTVDHDDTEHHDDNYDENNDDNNDDDDDDMIRCLDCPAGRAGSEPDLYAGLHIRHH